MTKMKKFISNVLVLIFAFSIINPIPKNVYAAPILNSILGMTFSNKLANPVNIDGNVNETNWNFDKSISNNVQDIVSNNTAAFDTAYDEANLYVAIKVTDALIVNNHHDAQLYEDDTVEIFLDGNNGKKSSYEADDYQIFIRATDNKVVVKQGNADVPETFTSSITTAVNINSDGTGYTVEAKIPFASLGTTSKEGNFIGLDVANDDNDSTDGASGRESTLCWNAIADTNWGNTSTFGTMFLKGKNAPVISTEASPIVEGTLEADIWHLDKTITVGDNNVSFGTLCDSNFLYVGVQVLDGTVQSTDSVELFIDGDNDKASTYDSNDRHFTMAYNKTASVPTGSSITGVVTKVADIAGGYSVEFAVPWTNLGVTQKNMTSLGIDLKVNDADATNPVATGFWNGDSNNSISTANFGDLIIYNKNVQAVTYTGPKGTFTDTSTDFANDLTPGETPSKIFDRSSSISIDNTRFDTTPKLYNGWANNQFITYKSPSKDLLNFKTGTVEQDGGGYLEFYSSSDNVTYTKLIEGVNYNITTLTPGSDATGWYGAIQYESVSLPSGTMYLKINFLTDSSNGYKADISNVTFDYVKDYSGPRIIFTDDAINLDKTIQNSGVYTATAYDSHGVIATWQAGAFVKYESPSGDILSLNMATLQMPGGNLPDPAFEIYESSDDVNYTKVKADSSIIGDASGDTGWYNKTLFEANTFKSGTRYIRIDYMATTDFFRESIYKVSLDCVKINNAPTSISNIYKTVPVNTTATGTVTGKDVDGDDLTYGVQAGPAHGTAIISDTTKGDWTYTPTTDYIGYDTFNVEVKDPAGATSVTKVVVMENYAATDRSLYVDGTKGKDSNDGLSEKKAFKTIQQASDVSCPGDTVYIMNGTYGEWNSEGVVQISRSGLPGHYITYKPAPGHNPIIHAVNAWNNITIMASYIRVDGLNIVGEAKNITQAEEQALYNDAVANGVNWSVETGRLNTNGIYVKPDTTQEIALQFSPNHVEILNNNVQDVPGGGISSQDADYLIIQNNLVHGCAIGMFANSGISVFHSSNTDEDTTSYKNIISGNTSYQNKPIVKWFASKSWSDGNGIIVDDNKCTQTNNVSYEGKTLIYNNIAYENSGSGIHAYCSSNVDIINNTAYNNNSEYLNWGQIFATATTNVRIINNIAYAKTGNIVTPNGASDNINVTYAYNVFYNGVVNDGKNDATNIVADPKFIDAANYNFNLAANSPAIDKGVSSLEAGFIPNIDIKGTVRPQGNGIDIGAIEASTVTLDKTTLASAISAARTLLGSKTVGTAVGNVPKGAKDYLLILIVVAEEVNKNEAATQLEVDAQVTSLAKATTIFNNWKQNMHLIEMFLKEQR